MISIKNFVETIEIPYQARSVVERFLEFGENQFPLFVGDLTYAVLGFINHNNTERIKNLDTYAINNRIKDHIKNIKKYVDNFKKIFKDDPKYPDVFIKRDDIEDFDDYVQILIQYEDILLDKFIDFLKQNAENIRKISNVKHYLIFKSFLAMFLEAHQDMGEL